MNGRHYNLDILLPLLHSRATLEFGFLKRNDRQPDKHAIPFLR